MTQPGVGGDGADVVWCASEFDGGAAVREGNDPFGKAVAVGIVILVRRRRGRNRRGRAAARGFFGWWFWRVGVGVGEDGALLDNVDIEDPGEHEGDERTECPPVAEQNGQDYGGNGEYGADEVKEVRKPAEVGNVGEVGGRPDGCMIPARGASETEADMESDGLTGTGDALDVAGCGGIVDGEGDGATLADLLDGAEHRVGSRPSCQLVGCLLVMQSRGEKKTIKPGGAARDDGTLGHCAKIGEGEKTASRQRDARDRMRRPFWELRHLSDLDYSVPRTVLRNAGSEAAACTTWKRRQLHPALLGC